MPASVLAAALLLGAAAAAQPVSEAPLEGAPIPAPGRPSQDAPTEAPWARRITQTYGVPLQLVDSLRAIGLARIEVECAVAVSTKAHRPIGEILLLRRAGMPWSEVSRAYGFTLLEALRPPPAARTKNAPPAPERSSP